MSRHGTCLACHKEIPEESLAVSLLHHIGEVTNLVPKTEDEHNNLLHKITLLSAWGQITGMALTLLAAVGIVQYVRRRRSVR